ncbi:MAG: hypothetical protein A2428_10935 [Bdellovibrionales bacterium RIFOXYC1_FULL_54_43]|nr:MAG: hypothetical protein A2428_10935 [Bdellovibrionales bacterium RIFOXYC1_FULL_54_43]OFZ81018.1 MAG: hypothetical protein A2603_04550 [Bdellovibrionales bacterium RIFOXYD1_FULL_55_31]
MSASTNKPRTGAQNSTNPGKDGQIQIDGFKQVLEMLRIADPSFRESLLRRLAARDAELARTLREDLNSL